MFSDMLRLKDAVKLDLSNLPTGSQVFSHYLYLRKKKISEGEWKSNVSLYEAARCVKDDVQAQWDHTGIPHTLHGQPGVEKVKQLVLRCQALNKIPLHRRQEDFGKDVSSLFDVAVCQHKGAQNCSCSPEKKVPPNWIEFLEDQRGPRQSKALLSDRVRSLRGGIRDLSELEKEKKERSELKAEKQSLLKEKLEKRKRKADEEIEVLFRKETLQSDDESLDVNTAGRQDDDDDDEWEDDSEWEDGEEGDYNTLELKYFAREVDRYQWSDRGAAKVGSGLLKDLGLVKKGDTKMLICPAKVRRERMKWGRKAEEEHNAKQLPQG